MKKELIFKQSITLNADINKVWDVLTNPALTKQYMYGCEALSDWKVGSPLIWKGAEDGIIYVKGNIVAIVPEKKLMYTTFDPNGTKEDIPDNYSTLTYELSEEKTRTTLTVSQEDVAGRDDKEQNRTEAIAGWEFVMKGLKEVAEKK